MITPLVFLDTETTGLDPARHQVWEVALAYEDSPAISFIVEHTLIGADEVALEVNGYWDRFPNGAVRETELRADLLLPGMLKGVTIVGSNPAFDTAFLRARWGIAPWHHRLINVAEGAMWLFGWDRPRGLADVIRHLNALGSRTTRPLVTLRPHARSRLSPGTRPASFRLVCRRTLPELIRTRQLRAAAHEPHLHLPRHLHPLRPPTTRRLVDQRADQQRRLPHHQGSHLPRPPVPRVRLRSALSARRVGTDGRVGARGE